MEIYPFVNLHAFEFDYYDTVLSSGAVYYKWSKTKHSKCWRVRAKDKGKMQDIKQIKSFAKIQNIKQRKSFAEFAKLQSIKPAMLSIPWAALVPWESVGHFKSRSAESIPLKWFWQQCYARRATYCKARLQHHQLYLCLCLSSLFLSWSLKKKIQRMIVTTAEARIPATEAVTGCQ